MVIERLKFSTHQEALEYLSVQMAAFIVESEMIGYDGSPPYIENQLELQNSKENFYGCFLQEQNCLRLVGAIAYTSANPIATITRLIVHPHYFRRGIATALMATITMIIAHDELSEVQVVAASQNTPALRFYSSCGFVVKESITTYHGIPLTVLKKYLSESS